MMSGRAFGLARLGGTVVGLGALALAAPIVAGPSQTPTFQTSVDLVVTDVHVVDRNGRPVPALTAAQFEVSVDGKKRRVVSVDFIDMNRASSAPVASPGPAPAVTPSSPTAVAPVPPARLFVIAIDSLSIPASVSPGMMAAARAFVKRLAPTDLVAVHTYPQGPKLDPTTDHGEVDRVLGTVIGSGGGALTSGRLQLTVAEIIDVAQVVSQHLTLSDPTYAEVLDRECHIPPTREDPCKLQLESESLASASYLEAIAMQSVGGLRDLIAALTPLNMNKTLVVMTAGMLASDRPGGRPDVSMLSLLAGQEAARANVTVYSVFVDTVYMARNSAEAQRAITSRYRTITRDSDVLSNWYDWFSGTAGGVLLKDLVGNGDVAFDRIVRETSAYYRLGVESLPADHDGRPRRLVVKVNARNATLRGQDWVVVPKGQGN